MTSLVWMFPAASKIVPFLSASFHVRVCVAPFIPLKVCAKPAACAATYLPAFALNAVLPSPKTSYAIARRTAQSSQFGTFGISGKFLAPIQVDAGDDSAGIDALKCSKRAP